MKAFGTYGPILIGGLLLAYVFLLGGISSDHSVQNYLVLCTGVLSVSLGLVALALTAEAK